MQLADLNRRIGRLRFGRDPAEPMSMDAQDMASPSVAGPPDRDLATPAPAAPEPQSGDPAESGPQWDREIVASRAAVRLILEASSEQLASRDFLLAAVRRMGIPFNTWPGFACFQDYMNSTRIGLIQIPTEYVDFLLALRRYELTTFCEIGVNTGSFSVLTAAYLLRTSGLREYHCVDVADSFIDRAHFTSVLPLHLHVPANSADLAGRAFDGVFIDGDHSYHWVKMDFLNVGAAARVCALHDIKATEYNGLDGGVVRYWAELRQTYRAQCGILEISHASPDWMGIGVMLLGGTR